MSEMKALILGGTGMLGHKVFEVLRVEVPETWCAVRCHKDTEAKLAPGLLDDDRVIGGVDVTDFAALEKLLLHLHPRVVINCVGVIKQRAQAKSAIPSIEINALLPHKLAEVCARWGGRLIHFSTDCVFSGLRGNYAEADLSDAQDLYGKSKYLGEVTTLANALTLRTSIIGRELTQFQSLLEWFLAQNGNSVQGYKRAIYSGVTTNYMATLIPPLISDFPDLSGLYQVTARAISKYDLLCQLREAYGLNIEIEPNDEFVCDRSMSGMRFEGATGIRTPQWSDLIKQLVNDKMPYASWRSNAR